MITKNQRQGDAANEIVISGIGVTSAIGQGKADFSRALLAGSHAFGVMQRAGRQADSAFIGAEIANLQVPERFSKKALHYASFSGQVALVTLEEAWRDANLDQVAPERIGLVIGGSNVQQRTLLQTYEQYRERPHFVRPDHALAFMDTDLCGLCTQEFGIQGLAYTVGGASASGQLAIIQALQAVQSGQVEVCIALGALMDLSHFECQALRSLGAMGSDRFAAAPDQACRPFDRASDGFIYGEACAALVIESRQSAKRRAARAWGGISGWAMQVDGNRNPNSSCEGEVKVIQAAMARAGIGAAQIDYVNPHGTGSTMGDPVELAALKSCGLQHARINATKSLTGHGISAAGAVEVVATLLQMWAGRLHPSRNLQQPIDTDFNWVTEAAVAHQMKHALSLSYGFGGITTALCLANC